MFVMVQAFKNVMDSPDCSLPLEERFGLAMKYAGVTITVTSVTDFIAFAIGASTVSVNKPGNTEENKTPYDSRPFSGPARPEVVLHILWHWNLNGLLPSSHILHWVHGA